MFQNIIHQHLPVNWTSMCDSDQDYELIKIFPSSMQYHSLKSKVDGAFNMQTSKIVRVQNPYLYAQFLLKKEAYETRGIVTVRELFHDTAESNIPSIVSGNLDWRLANRVKYGRGVSFSPDPAYANCQSSRSNGTDRAMIIADVLVGIPEIVSSSRSLPSSGYDTTVGNRGKVYVKYYDNEFYPKYVVFYKSHPQGFRRRW